ncbi:MAG: ribokinase [Micromonosporaceae bacterium]|nr:ribokinase [Micromonosporaceae bacterium]
MRRVLVVGDLVTDVIAAASGPVAEGTDTEAAISFRGGGSAANTAAWLARLGVSVTLVAAVGQDAAGEERIAELRDAGVACAAVRLPAPTGTVVVLATGAERSMLCDRGANALLAPEHVDAALHGAPDAAHLHLSGYPLFDERSRPAGLRALAAARSAGLSTSVDAASAGPLRRVGAAAFLHWVRDADLLFANADEARVLVGDGPPRRLAEALAGVAGAAIVKLGADGAVQAGIGGFAQAPAAPADVTDVTGAGDAFAAGALHAWLAGAAPEQVLAEGAGLAAEAISRPGARPAR